MLVSTPERRDLTGVYVKVNRDGKKVKCDFSDLTYEEQKEFFNRDDATFSKVKEMIRLIMSSEEDLCEFLLDEGISYNQLCDIAIVLSNSVYLIGEMFDVHKIDEEED